jgi:hypothetical protein
MPELPRHGAHPSGACWGWGSAAAIPRPRGTPPATLPPALCPRLPCASRQQAGVSAGHAGPSALAASRRAASRAWHTRARAFRVHPGRCWPRAGPLNGRTRGMPGRASPALPPGPAPAGAGSSAAMGPQQSSWAIPGPAARALSDRRARARGGARAQQPGSLPAPARAGARIILLCSHLLREDCGGSSASKQLLGQLVRSSLVSGPAGRRSG